MDNRRGGDFPSSAFDTSQPSDFHGSSEQSATSEYEERVENSPSFPDLHSSRRRHSYRGGGAPVAPPRSESYHQYRNVGIDQTFADDNHRPTRNSQQRGRGHHHDSTSTSTSTSTTSSEHDHAQTGTAIPHHLTSPNPEQRGAHFGAPLESLEGAALSYRHAHQSSHTMNREMQQQMYHHHHAAAGAYGPSAAPPDQSQAHHPSSLSYGGVVHGSGGQHPSMHHHQHMQQLGSLPYGHPYSAFYHQQPLQQHPYPPSGASMIDGHALYPNLFASSYGGGPHGAMPPPHGGMMMMPYPPSAPYHGAAAPPPPQNSLASGMTTPSGGHAQPHYSGMNVSHDGEGAALAQHHAAAFAGSYPHHHPGGNPPVIPVHHHAYPPTMGLASNAAAAALVNNPHHFGAIRHLYGDDPHRQHHEGQDEVTELTNLRKPSSEGGPPNPSTAKRSTSDGSGGSGNGAAGIPNKARRAKNKDRPKRPLSAYNLFFKDERAKMLAKLKGETETVGANASDDDAGGGEDDNPSSRKRARRSQSVDDETDGAATGDILSSELTRGSNKKKKSIGFAPMAQIVAAKWKNIDEERLEHYKKKASADMERYRSEMEVFNRKQQEGLEQSRVALEASVDEETRRRYFQSEGT